MPIKECGTNNFREIEFILPIKNNVVMFNTNHILSSNNHITSTVQCDDQFYFYLQFRTFKI